MAGFPVLRAQKNRYAVTGAKVHGDFRVAGNVAGSRDLHDVGSRGYPRENKTSGVVGDGVLQASATRVAQLHIRVHDALVRGLGVNASEESCGEGLRRE